MLLIALIFAAAAAVWFLILMRLGGLLAGCVAIVLCGSCLGHPFFHVSILTLDRLLWAVIVAWYGMERWQRWKQGQAGLAWTRVDLWMLAFLGVLSYSTMTHDWHYDGSQPMSRLLFLYLMPAGLYWIVRHSPVSPPAARSIHACFAAFGLYLAGTACAEVLGIHAVIFPRYIVASDFTEFLGRGRGPFLNPSANGIYLGTGLACCLTFFTAWPRAQRASVSLPKLDRISVFALAGAGFITLGGGATLTRCVWLGIFASLLLIMWSHLPRRQSLGTTILIGALGCLVVVASWNHLVAFKRDKNVSVADMKESAKLRPMLAAVAWQIFRDHPLSGVGYGQYKQADQRYIAQRNIAMPLDKVRPYHQHNVLLSLLTETGLAGTIPFIALLLVWSRTAWRVWHCPGLATHLRHTALVFAVCLVNYLANGMFQDVALIPMVNTILFVEAALLMSVAQQARAIEEIASPVDTVFNLVRPLLNARMAQRT
ncbi:MAG: O-antigen ligase family protein [Planctomycetales bacterium]|nr:O-antigen ligase family protein [Planctomycetales bacterium]